MNGFHGIIFAYSAEPELRELSRRRTAASLPFCGRYRIIDFALSSMSNSGIHDVGVIMQRDYQSLLDHMGSGKAWDLSRKNGGLRMLPPFGLPEYHKGNYIGTIEALNAVSGYVRDIQQDNVVLMLGNIVANIDLQAVMRRHISSGASVTAICTARRAEGCRLRYVAEENGRVSAVRFAPDGEGVSSLECYIIKKDVLLGMMDGCREKNQHFFHLDAISRFLAEGGDMDVYLHPGYAKIIHTVDSYYAANMDMLCAENRGQMFPAERPVRTRSHEEVSTYYGESAYSRNSLVADNCIIEGSVENSIISSGVHIGKGACVRNSIVMRGCSVGEGTELTNVIADKRCVFSPGITLTGSPRLPIVIPKASEI